MPKKPRSTGRRPKRSKPPLAKAHAFRPLASPLDEQRESRGARGSRLLRWQSDSPAKVVTRPCSRACVQARASVRAGANGGPGVPLRRPSQAGCGSGHAWLLRPLGSRAPGAGQIVTSLARSAIRSPHQHQRDCQEAVVCEGFCDNETWIDRGPRDLRRRGASLLRPWGIGTSFGTLRTSVARSRSF
jgi:hypothetical protein